MKKFLSLMLAMIMVMSLVTVGAGAAFTDAADIEYTEAVELMAGLKILEGPGDGSFNPKGNLTRGAAAKIIAYIALGAADADEMTYDEVVFPDVPTNSATAPYIAWCAEQGIINGYTDGTFGRKNNVTGHAFLKMALTAIGQYGQYTGTGWQVRVVNAAKNANLLKGIDTDEVILSDPASRELACQIAFNAMNFNKTADTGYLVEGMPFNTLTDAAAYINLMKLDVTPKAYTTAGGTLLNTVHKVDAPATGVIVENSANADTKLTKLDDGKYYAVETGLAQLGNTVKIYFKKTTSYDEAKGYTVFSVVDNCKEIAVTKDTKAADLKAALKAAGVDVTKDIAAGTGASLSNAGVVTTGAATPAITLLGETPTKGSDLMPTANETLTLVVNNKAIVGVKAELVKTLDKVTKVDTTADALKIKFSAAGEKENGVKNTTTGKVADVVNEYAGIAKDDIVVITKVGAIYNVEKAQTVTGIPTKVSGKTITIDGVAYKQKGTGDAGKTPVDVAGGEIKFDKEYTLYLDGQGNYIIAVAVTPTVTKTTVFYVDKYTETSTEGAYGGTPVVTYYAQVIDLNGVEKNVKVSATTYGNLTAQGLFKISEETVTEGDKQVKYTKFESTGKTTTDDVAATDKKFDIAGDNYYYFADDVKFISVTGSKGTLKTVVKTGVQKVTDDDIFFVATQVGTTKNYTVSTVIVSGEFAAADLTATKDVVYAVESSAAPAVPYTDNEGKVQTGYEHKVYIGDEKVSIITTSATALKGYIQLTPVATAKDVYTAANYVTLPSNLKAPEAVKNMYNGLLTTAGTAASDEDVTGVTVVNLTTKTEVPTDATKLSTKDTVALVYDEKGEDIILIYVTATTRAK